MENKIKLVGNALFVKHRQTQTGKQITALMVECQNTGGYTSKIPVTYFHNGEGSAIRDGDEIRVLGSLRNAMVKNTDPNAKKEFRLEAMAEQIDVLSADVPF